MRVWACALLLLPLLAGCSAPPAKPDAPQAGPQVQGWVVDETLRPIADASVVLVGVGVEARTDTDGHYQFEAPSGVDLLVTVTAPGFLPASQATGAFAGAVHVMNFTLERVPVERPYQVVESFNGFLRCGVVAVVLEDPSKPHEHQGVRCSTVLEDTRNQWQARIPDNVTGIVLEVDWEPGNPTATALVLKAVIDATGEVLAFLEGPPILKVQFSQDKVAQTVRAGFVDYTVQVEAGAGTGGHEHGALGVFHEQAFTLYATSFYNGPADPAYTVADQP